MINVTNRKIIGLIGMSGAGKSTVCRIFAENGYKVIDCDISAREVVQLGYGSLVELKNELSSDIILPDGTLDRRKTAELIFNNDDKRMTFNRIIYPYITYNVIEKIKSAECDVLLDAPTLYEAQLDGICDSIVSVCAEPQSCIERIMERDGISEQLAAARLTSQHDIEWYRRRSSHCILNNGTLDELYAAGQAVIKELKGN